MTNSQHVSRTPIQSLRLFFTGVAMGIADVIPGVSGGTMAFILGIYEELINAIKSFNLEFIKLLLQLKFKQALDHVPWKFLLALGLGIGSAVFTLAHAVSWLLENQPVFLFSFFFGLILASILAVGATVKWSPMTLISMVVGTVVAYLIVGLVPLQMPHDPLTLFLSGAVAIMAMILPGISGSFILLILGQYEYVLEAVKSLDIFTILFVGAGAVVGITGFSRVLSWLFKHYEQATIAVLVGFMLGSLRKIWPWKETLETTIDRHGDVVPLVEQNILPAFSSQAEIQQVVIASVLCLAGFLVVTYLDHLQSKSNPFFRLMGRSRRDADIVAAK